MRRGAANCAAHACAGPSSDWGRGRLVERPCRRRAGRAAGPGVQPCRRRGHWCQFGRAHGACLRAAPARSAQSWVLRLCEWAANGTQAALCSLRCAAAICALRIHSLLIEGLRTRLPPATFSQCSHLPTGFWEASSLAPFPSSLASSHPSHSPPQVLRCTKSLAARCQNQRCCADQCPYLLQISWCATVLFLARADDPASPAASTPQRHVYAAVRILASCVPCAMTNVTWLRKP